MKLELKHLAGYLPYNVKILDFVNGGNCIINDTYVLEPKNCHRCLTFAKETEKLILRPLSDLTKEIEVNGEKFIPESTLFRLFGDMTQFQILEKGFYSLNYGYYLKIEQLPHNIVSQLLEWHFDIYGLIEKGLAIDINTLKN